jgi:hypothetical protein
VERYRQVLAISAVVAMAAVAAAAVVVAIDNAPQVAATTGDDDGGDDRVGRLQADVRRLEEELAEAKAQQKELRQRLNEAERRVEFLRVLAKEIAVAGGGGGCAQADSISVEILEPEPGSSTTSPVVAHLVAAQPLGCRASFFLTVDGVPFRPRGSQSGGGMPADPVPYRPMRQGQPTEACSTAVFRYVELDLPPGLHTLEVNGGCPEGRPADPASVNFVVT